MTPDTKKEEIYQFLGDSEELFLDIMDVVIDHLDLECDEHGLAEQTIEGDEVLVALRALALVAKPFVSAIKEDDDRARVINTMITEMTAPYVEEIPN